MDSGCLEPGETLDQEFDMNKDLLPEELIWLMDELSTREVAWLTGYPLSQTLFTSVHIDRLLWPDPKSLDDSTFIRGRDPSEMSLTHRILRSYCLLLIKTCDLVLGMVTSQHYYEEEDFTTQLFNRELLHKFAAEDISVDADEIYDEVMESDIGTELKLAIEARLSFRNNALDMLMQHPNGQSPLDSSFEDMRENLETAQETHSLSRIVPDAFSTKLQRRLASTVPPRPMVTVSMEEAWTFWQRMLDDCKHVFSVHQAAHSQDLLAAFHIFGYSSPQPSTYPRALLQSFLTRDNLVASRIEPLHFLEEDLKSLTLPASQLLLSNGERYGKLYYGNQRVGECMQNFADRFEHNFGNLYRALCLNSCRIRRTFCHALLEWDALQSQVEELDSVIQEVLQEKPTAYLPGLEPTFAFSLSSWVYHHKLNVIRLTVQMGFELMIYTPQELAGMYWYLSSICDAHLSHLERISHFVTAKDTAIKRSWKDSTAKDQGLQECKAALDRLYRQYAWVKATHLLASTMHMIFIVLQRFEIFVSGQPLYSSDMVRYEIRMKPFLGLSIPEPLLSDDFNKEVQVQYTTTEELLNQATILSADAKKAWEQISKTTWNVYEKTEGDDGLSVLDERWTADVKDCLKAAIAASLCVVRMKKAQDDDAWKVQARKEARLPELGEKGRWHRWWIIPSLPS